MVWTEVQTISEDQCKYVGGKSTLHWHLPPPIQPKEVDYFYLLFPMEQLQIICKLTNVYLEANRHSLLSKGEFLRFLGIRLSTTLTPMPGLRSYWEAEINPESGFPPGNFLARFGMNYNRFITIQKCLTISQKSTEVLFIGSILHC